MKKFITYHTSPVYFIFNGIKGQLPSAAVWAFNGHKYNVIDTGDLKTLQEKHSIPDSDCLDEENNFKPKSDAQ